MKSQSQTAVTSTELAAAELERIRSGLRIVALRALHDREAADEAVQETLARLVVALREGRTGPGSAAAFAYGIARHVIGDVLRARGRSATHEPITDGVPQRGPDPLAALITGEERNAVRRALAAIGAADRNLLRLVFVEGLGSRELAARLGEPDDRVRKRKQRALERLRRAFFGARGSHETRPSANKEEE